MAATALVLWSPSLPAQEPARTVVTAGAVVPVGPYRSEFGAEAEWRPAPWVTLRRQGIAGGAFPVYLRLGAMGPGRAEVSGLGSDIERGPGLGLGVGAGVQRAVSGTVDVFVGVAIDRFQVFEFAGDDSCTIVGPECVRDDAFDGQTSPFGLEAGLSVGLPAQRWAVEVWSFGGVGYRSHHPTLAPQLRIQLARSLG